MGLSILLFANLAAVQGSALELSVAHEPTLEAVVVSWSDREIPSVRVGETWSAVIGIDLAAPPGADVAEISLTYKGGRMVRRQETIEIASKEFPTTRLEVEPGYVDLSPENQARAARETAEIDAIYATVTAERYWSAPFTIPVDGVTGGRNFGHSRVFNGQPRAPHAGADLRAATGTPVRASNRGRVVLAKNLFFSGNAVFLDHGQGLYSVYLHLSEIQVEPGTLVERGQLLGLAGATGRVTGPHLHWGVRILDARIDPFTLLDIGAD